jgi:superfamily I DNA/RNA helicase
MFNPRPMQAEVLKYTSGWMGVSAVPGSGKTHTLSALAARLIMDAGLKDDQEILIVTLVNSAVNNFSTRIAGFIKEQGLLPDIGYRVRTLHGIAHDIVRERPELAGLSEHLKKYRPPIYTRIPRSKNNIFCPISTRSTAAPACNGMTASLRSTRISLVRPRTGSSTPK